MSSSTLIRLLSLLISLSTLSACATLADPYRLNFTACPLANAAIDREPDATKTLYMQGEEQNSRGLTARAYERYADAAMECPADMHAIQSQRRLAKLYEDGRVTNEIADDIHIENRLGESLPTDALGWYTLAAMHGDLYSMGDLIHLHGRADSPYRDDDRVTYWELRYRVADWHFPRLRYTSLAVLDPLHPMEANLEWPAATRLQVARIERDARRGIPGAQVSLGAMYETGIGMEQDSKRAIEWYRRAAVQGDAFGQYFLGLMYGRGNGTDRDLETAASWFAKAQAQGYFLAAESYWREKVKPRFFLFSE